MTDPRNIVRLNVGGVSWHGWHDVSVRHSMETTSGDFKLTLSSQWPESLHIERYIKAGSECSLSIGPDLVSKGFVEDIDISVDKKGVVLTVAGRDRTGDLVDCSAWPAQDLNGLKLEDIARRLCVPFQIPVITQCDTGTPFRRVSMSPGEKIHQFLDQLCSMRAVTKYADGLGNLVLARAGTIEISDRLATGHNILNVHGSFSTKELVSRLMVRAQTAGGEGKNAKGHAQAEGVATNDAIRHRPLIVIAEELAEGVSLQNYADWSMRARQAKSWHVSLAVQGWRHAGGGLWPLNQRVKVDIPELRIKEIMLITATEFVLDGEGTRTKLSLSQPSAFDLLPKVPQEKGAK